MGEAIQYMFELREVTELLLKKQDIHKGLWMISIEFGQGAATIPTGPDGKTLQPAAINIVQHIGIKKHEGAPTNLTVDAEEVNPLPKRVTKGTPKVKAKK
ncbi:MAG TPA: hypothetical protein VE135_03590 [Pyrinomonadaceae bacterium]|nr:hypothetical protein [Pyrinomonadaceae bacterium]